jgi:transcription elongation factor Elf1
MNTANSKSTLLNNSFTSDTQDKICNCLGCNEFADSEISLKIGEKSITIMVCKNCKHKFKES